MREVEFLPGWYAQLLRRRRWVILQTWLTIAVAGGLAMRLSLLDRNVKADEAALDTLRGQLVQTHSTLQQMERLEVLRKKWREQAEVLTRMGVHVESGRLIGKLAEAMPESISLLQFHMAMEETALPIPAGTTIAANAQRPMDRRLRVRLQGVAPTDVELATFLTELNRVSFFERVAPTYVRDRRQSGHKLREFELTFTVNLNHPAGA
jgi:hypothetical protein